MSAVAASVFVATQSGSIGLAPRAYDHLAGRLGVSLADALEGERLLAPLERGCAVTGEGERRLGDLGVDVHALRERRRTLTRPCLDWTERRPHVAGALGAALAARLLELGWVRRLPGSRAVAITSDGRRELLANFAVRV